MDIPAEKLIKEQTELANKITIVDSFKKANLVAGIGIAYTDDKIICTIAVCNSKMELVESKTSVSNLQMKYVPGFMFYREGPVIIDAYSRLEKKPDVIICPFNGILHPRRIGAASHLGLVLDVPTIGVASSLICGREQGNSIVMDKEVRAQKIFTKVYAKPLYVSPGHKISLTKSVEIVKESIREPHKLPEPLHIANRIAKSEKNKLMPAQEKTTQAIL